MQIDWGEPLLPVGEMDPVVAGSFKKILGTVPRFVRVCAPSPWLNEFNLLKFRTGFRHTSTEDLALASFVSAQENACRYCYGTARATLRFMGHSEEWIDRIERDVQAGDLTPRSRAVIAFARQLAVSNPRP